MRCAVCGGELDARERRCAACDAARQSSALPGLDLELDLPEAPRALAPSEPLGAGAAPLELELAGPMPSRPPRAAPAALASYAPPGGAPALAPGPAAELGLSQAGLPLRAPVAKPPDLSLRFEYDTPLVNGAAIPGAIAFALLLKLLGFDFLVYTTAGMWTHELGHAIVAWLSGILAIPLPFFTIATSDERNWVVIALVFAGWLALGVHGLRMRSTGLVSGALGIAGLQILLSFVMTPGRAAQWITFAGLAGELVLSTVMMLAFYVRLPWRWDFWRYPVLATCAVAYVHAFVRWIGVVAGTAAMPRGSAVGDSSEGDVERLERTGEFTAEALARTNLGLALVCAVVLVLVYLRMMQKARRIASGELEAHGEERELLS